MRKLIIALLMSVPVSAVAAQDVTAVYENGTVILKMLDGNDEKTYVVTQVFQIGGSRSPKDYESAPFSLDFMIRSGRGDDIPYMGCVPRGLVRGVLNWVSDYVMNELERLLGY